MQVIRKAVIPVAGLGTRMLPATKVIPKEMLPIVDKPLIQYVVQEAISAGFNEIVLVTHASKNSIENHFDTTFELETTLERRVKRQLLDEIKAICPKHVTIISVRQAQAKGLGHAILCAYPVIGDEAFAVLLPDVIIHNDEGCDLLSMLNIFRQTDVGQIMVEGVEPHLVNQYGIADVKGHILTSGHSAAIEKIIEKPAVDKAPSNLAVVGRYILPKEIWGFLAKTPAGVGDEIQLTDAIAMLLEESSINAFYMQGTSYDCGNKFGYMRANVEFALRHPEINDKFNEYLKTVIK